MPTLPVSTDLRPDAHGAGRLQEGLGREDGPLSIPAPSLHINDLHGIGQATRTHAGLTDMIQIRFK